MNSINKKLTYAFILLLAVTIPNHCAMAGDQQELKWSSFTEGLKEAKSKNKKVLVDVYTDWCKYCKKMDKEVYEDQNVVKYLSDNYILVKLNAESASKVNYKGQTVSENEIAGMFGVNGYPTTLFLNAEGEFLTPVSGFIPADRFLDIAKFIGENYYEKMNWEEYQKQKDGNQKN